AEARALHESLERAILAVMAQLHARRVECDRVLGKLGRRREDEHGLGIDEALDQPRRRDAIDVGPGSRDPAPPTQLGEIERRRGRGTSGLWTSGAHGDGLLKTAHLGAAGSAEVVDRTDALMLFRQASKLVVRAGARTRRFPIETLEQLAVARGQMLVVLVARRVEELEHLGRADVLDLLHAHERGVAAVALSLLSMPLNVRVPIRRVGS